MVDETRVFTEINNGMKRMIDDFTQDYQDSVERFVRSYRSIMNLFKERGDDLKILNYLQQFFHWKCLEIERFKLNIKLPNASFEISSQEFGKPKLAV